MQILSTLTEKLIEIIFKRGVSPDTVYRTKYPTILMKGVALTPSNDMVTVLCTLNRIFISFFINGIGATHLKIISTNFFVGVLSNFTEMSDNYINCI